MGILALANMVPKIEPDSQWRTVNFTSTRSFSLLMSFLSANIPDSSSFNLNLLDVWELTFETWRVMKQVLRHIYIHWVLPVQAGINMANYCGGRWVKVLMEVVTPQTGRGDSPRETRNQGRCIALWRACWRATLFNLSLTEHEISTTIKASADVQRDNFTLSHDMNKCTSREKWLFYFRAKLECPGSFPPTMPCTSRVKFTEEVLDHGPESLRGEDVGRTQADGDREYRGTTPAPWHLTT